MKLSVLQSFSEVIQVVVLLSLYALREVRPVEFKRLYHFVGFKNSLSFLIQLSGFESILSRLPLSLKSVHTVDFCS